MKANSCFLIACLCTSVLFAADDVVVPKGVRYKAAPARVNEEAAKLLASTLLGKPTDDEVLAVFEPMCVICGPGLWSNIKQHPSVAKLELGNATISVPQFDASRKIVGNHNLDGKLLQSREDMLAFWKAFTGSTDRAELKIRKLTPDELSLYWATIPFDITEPVFVADNNKHTIVVQFTSPEKLRIAWIDDLQSLRRLGTGPATRPATRPTDKK